MRAADGAYRVFYVVEDARNVYVLHAFEKTSNKTRKADLHIGAQRYRDIP